MILYLVHTPWWLKKLYPFCTWDLASPPNTVYLTFDDGPHPEATPFVLDQLNQFGFHASFFCIGKNILAHPGISEQIKAAGHTIGNHTMNHVNGWKTNDELYLREMIETDALITSQYFRPPYGRIRRSQVKLLRGQRPGMKVIMWNILSGDFNTDIDGPKCAANVIRYIRPGSIIVFHDSAKAFPRLRHALPEVLTWLAGNNYTSNALGE